jgi:hypothetical protein
MLHFAIDAIIDFIIFIFQLDAILMVAAHSDYHAAFRRYYYAYFAAISPATLFSAFAFVSLLIPDYFSCRFVLLLIRHISMPFRHYYYFTPFIFA